MLKNNKRLLKFFHPLACVCERIKIYLTVWRIVMGFGFSEFSHDLSRQLIFNLLWNNLKVTLPREVHAILYLYPEQVDKYLLT